MRIARGSAWTHRPKRSGRPGCEPKDPRWLVIWQRLLRLHDAHHTLLRSFDHCSYCASGLPETCRPTAARPGGRSSLELWPSHSRVCWKRCSECRCREWRPLWPCIAGTFSASRPRVSGFVAKEQGLMTLLWRYNEQRIVSTVISLVLSTRPTRDSGGSGGLTPTSLPGPPISEWDSKAPLRPFSP